jgi:hypothetical protein
MDFIKQLPNSENFTAILVVVDHFAKQALFILTHDTITSAQLAELFIIYVFSRHGVSSQSLLTEVPNLCLISSILSERP